MLPMQTIRRFALVPSGLRLSSSADASWTDKDANAGKPTETPAARKTFRRENELIALSKGDTSQNRSPSLPAMTQGNEKSVARSNAAHHRVRPANWEASLSQRVGVKQTNAAGFPQADSLASPLRFRQTEHNPTGGDSTENKFPCTENKSPWSPNARLVLTNKPAKTPPKSIFQSVQRLRNKFCY